MKLRWVPMQLLNEKVTWDDLVDGQLNLGGSCDGKLKGEPPAGVWDVQFLQTFLRTVVNQRAMFEWDWVGYGVASLKKCVGPGVYVSQKAGTPYSVVEGGDAPGILRD